MKQITEENLINFIKEKFPDFASYWDSYVNTYGLDDGLTFQMTPLWQFAIDIIKSNDESKKKEFFGYIEHLLCVADEDIQTAITTSFFECLLNKDPSEIQFKSFYQYLGENSIAYCRAWDEFTGVRTEGLWDDESWAAAMERRMKLRY